MLRYRGWDLTQKIRLFIESGFPDGLTGKESICNAGDTGDTGSVLGGDDPLEKEMATTPVFLPEKSHGQRSLVSYSPWGCKSQTRPSD